MLEIIKKVIGMIVKYNNNKNIFLFRESSSVRRSIGPEFGLVVRKPRNPAFLTSEFPPSMFQKLCLLISHLKDDEPIQ